ncbi:MAG: YHS domain-containing protein [Nitrososphaerota archaeon]|nr:YHS domain-containing protein [Nitrososphaerota archaeon]
MKKMDPVCGMEVDESTRYKSLYRGKVYFFCSANCKAEFERDPDGYLRSGPRSMPE